MPRGRPIPIADPDTDSLQRIKEAGVPEIPKEEEIRPQKVHKNHFAVLNKNPEKPPVISWFCINCTREDLFQVLNCVVCGEHRDSDVMSSLADEARASKFQLKASLAEHHKTLIGYDEKMLLHYEVDKVLHPPHERPDRLTAIITTLESAGIFPGCCSLVPSRQITREELLKVHSMQQIDVVESTSKMHRYYLDRDTYANDHSSLAAKLAAGICADLATAIVWGGKVNGFAVVRPPGHHAGVSDSRGFCLHNNAAVAATAARAAGARKVLILDWDVHFGDGTAEIFESDVSVLYISLHRHDKTFYPGTGHAEKVGTKPAEGYTVNVPWDFDHVGDHDYLFAFTKIVLPIASEFAPDLVIISAGFDAAEGDPIGKCDVTPTCYAQMTQMLSSFAEGKVLVILEGGYNLRSIARSSKSVVEVLLGGDVMHVPDNLKPTTLGLQTVAKVIEIQRHYWSSLQKIEMPESNDDKVSTRKGKVTSRQPVKSEGKKGGKKGDDKAPSCGIEMPESNDDKVSTRKGKITSRQPAKSEGKKGGKKGDDKAPSCGMATRTTARKKL